MPKIITLNNNSESVIYLSQKDKRLAKVISMVGEITYEPYDNTPYAFLIHEIIEQMLSIKAGAKIYAKLENLCNGDVTPENVNRLSDEQIKSIGTSYSKANYIRGVTNSIIDGSLDLDSISSKTDNEVIKSLTKLRGIGTWTAKMYLIFVLDRQNVLPYEDVAFLQAYKWAYKTDDCSPKTVTAKCKKWSPYSSVAVRYMYRALDMGLTKNEFHLFK